MKKWKRLLTKEIRINRFRTLTKIRARLPNGMADDFYLVKVGHIVCALVLTKEDKIVLAKQYRLGPDKLLMELPGGRVDKGETPRQAIIREVLEETGVPREDNFSYQK